ncbi:MAG: hypothetical protein H6585_10220 [Flavobacteriales bacterium]|nr:hypothetical protein [Flavobacteriales bacterium]
MAIRYTKDQLEILLYKQLENLDAMNEHVRLVKEQNEMLLTYNHKLIEKLSEDQKKPVPYPKPKRKRNGNT